MVATCSTVVCDLSHNLLQGLRNGLFDIVVAMTPDGPAEGAFMTWKETLAWVAGRNPPINRRMEEHKMACASFAIRKDASTAATC